jgi:hypothetical protein
LYQGTALAVPQMAQNRPGFSPRGFCAVQKSHHFDSSDTA